MDTPKHSFMNYDSLEFLFFFPLLTKLIMLLLALELLNVHQEVRAQEVELAPEGFRCSQAVWFIFGHLFNNCH